MARLVLSWATVLGNCELLSYTAIPEIQISAVDRYLILPLPFRYLLEHGLKADGRPDPDAKDIGEPGSFETFFTETGNGKYVPRSIFVDLDPSVSRHRNKISGSRGLIEE